MLKLSGKIKTLPFDFTDVDDKVHKLEVSEFTIGDVKKIIDAQEPLTENKNLTVGEQSEIIIASRVTCSVKVRGTQEYFWDTIDDLTKKGYPNDLVGALYTEVNKLNPLDTTDLDTKKN